MAEHTRISWTDSTVNFWWGCTKVGPGCDHCYAETWAKRTGGELWGPGAERRKIKGAPVTLLRLDNGYADWAADYEVRTGNALAFGLPVPTIGRRRRVFVQSMSDLFDLEVPAEWFAEAWQAIECCNRLDIQIVTKRLPAVERRLAAISRSAWPKHAGLIATIVNQAEAERDIPRLLALKTRLGIPWVGLSMEPLLGAVLLRPEWLREIDWIIVGGESGGKARPMSILWVREIRDQCAQSGVAFHFKQWGEWHPAGVGPAGRPGRFAFGDYSFDRAVMHMADGYPRQFAMAGARSLMERVGKGRAGRSLDGRQHDGFPQVRHG